MATFYLNHEAELYHYGVKGMKWGKHKYADDYKKHAPNSTPKYYDADGNPIPVGPKNKGPKTKAREQYESLPNAGAKSGNYYTNWQNGAPMSRVNGYGVKIKMTDEERDAYKLGMLSTNPVHTSKVEKNVKEQHDREQAAKNAALAYADQEAKKRNAQSRMAAKQESYKNSAKDFQAKKKAAAEHAHHNATIQRTRNNYAMDKVLAEQEKERRRRKTVRKDNERSSISRNAKYHRGKR